MSIFAYEAAHIFLVPQGSHTPITQMSLPHPYCPSLTSVPLTQWSWLKEGRIGK